MPRPIRFVFGVHLHQPVGNFGYVFQQHLDEVYQPFLDLVERENFLPVVLHLSGPLLEWLEEHGGAYLDQLGRLAADKKVELLTAGMYEPVLAALPRADRIEQIGWLREAIRKRLGVDATGLWLTERVWEPELAADIAAAGVRYVLVDDRHFLATGFERDQLYVPWLTESDGKRVSLFSIDERLRYFIPFREPEETAAHLRGLAAAGQPLAIFADDGEKFGGWPGTREWVYQNGWLQRFVTTIRGLIDSGEVTLTTLSETLDAVPHGGLAYLPTASYREMEGWSLPPNPARQLHALETSLGPERLEGTEGGLIRGGHWRNFMVKYAEANRMHKMMFALSELCRKQGNPAEARRAIGRAQCNDVYWHGVFGGLYLPHLRHTVWRELAWAESVLRNGQPLTYQVIDLDADGSPEIWIHSSRISLVISTARGGAIEVLLDLTSGLNLADALTRRLESYHETGDQNGEKIPVDPNQRALFVEWLAEQVPTQTELLEGSQPITRSWARARCQWSVNADPESVQVHLAADDSLSKTITVHNSGAVEVRYLWPAGEGHFVSELSLGHPATVAAEPPTEPISYTIETVAKSERGLDRTRQGECVTLVWPATLGKASVRLSW